MKESWKEEQYRESENFDKARISACFTRISVGKHNEPFVDYSYSIQSINYYLIQTIIQYNLLFDIYY